MTVDVAPRPTSSAQAEATRAGFVAAPERIDGDTFVVPMPTGIPFVVSTLCYVLRDRTGAAHVIDPGVNAPDNLDLLFRELRAHGIDRVATVTATHLHPDHVGLAPLVREQTGARLCLGRIEGDSVDAPWRERAGRVAALDAWGVPGDRRDDLLAIPESKAGARGADADLLLDDGDELPVVGRSVRALVTPGHTPGHLCFVESEANRVFTGDHVLPHINPGLGLGHPFDGNATSVGIAALEAIAALDATGPRARSGVTVDEPDRERYLDRDRQDAPIGGDRARLADRDRPLEALPGHGYRFVGLRSRALAIAAHHRARTAEVAAVLERDPDASVWDTASRVQWTAGWDGLSGFHRLSALAQTAQHVDRARARQPDGSTTS
ncbi:hypothetical protein GCM10011490_01540 [Pseudoclavibacter endophyticus]|nr:MBL fold metallo-hydrolase [Pseudoclavibacter endophyticus]GGA55356.1 hypothetical protein GCM10011490_01540 [Pseudoclavibacter endophyticus]